MTKDDKKEILTQEDIQDMIDVFTADELKKLKEEIAIKSATRRSTYEMRGLAKYLQATTLFSSVNYYKETLSSFEVIIYVYNGKEIKIINEKNAIMLVTKQYKYRAKDIPELKEKLLDIHTAMDSGII